jgi:hypothetical protein
MWVPRAFHGVQTPCRQLFRGNICGSWSLNVQVGSDKPFVVQ